MWTPWQLRRFKRYCRTAPPMFAFIVATALVVVVMGCVTITVSVMAPADSVKAARPTMTIPVPPISGRIRPDADDSSTNRRD